MYLLTYLLRQKFTITLLAYNYLLLFFDEVKIINNVQIANAVMNQFFQNTSNVNIKLILAYSCRKYVNRFYYYVTVIYILKSI